MTDKGSKYKDRTASSLIYQDPLLGYFVSASVPTKIECIVRRPNTAFELSP